MYIDTSFESVNTKYPEKVEKVLKNIENLKGEDVDFDKFEWQYQVYEQVEPLSFNEMIKEANKDNKEKNEKSFKERVNDRLSKIEVFVSASNEERFSHKNSLNSIPEKIREHIENQIENKIKEKERVKNLSDDERRKEVGDALVDVGMDKKAASNISEETVN